jgi:dolichol-phosphate mannosyltransferase
MAGVIVNERQATNRLSGPSFLLSVVIPAFNEERTIRLLLDRVALAPYAKQIIVIDDGSTDGTAAVVEDWLAAKPAGALEDVELLAHTRNQGKGAAIRTGLQIARGEVTIIQDADLEYDPQDYPALIEPICAGFADVVYGSRHLTRRRTLGPWPNRICLRLLNVAVLVLYGVRVTDEATCYKAFRTAVLKSLDLRCQRFEFCPEVTAKLCRRGIAIREVPISYVPRTAAEGKKIGWRDGIEAFWTLLRWRVARINAQN